MGKFLIYHTSLKISYPQKRWYHYVHQTIKVPVSVQENGSFSAAADELCITKAAVGQQMKLLEESLKTPLFDRNGYRPSLNAVGISFVKEAQKVLDNYDKLFNSLGEDDDFSGTITVGSVPSAILALVPLSVKSMMKEVTNTKIRIVPGMSTDLYDHVLNGSIDVVILSQPQRIEPSLQWVVLVRRTACAVDLQ